MSAIDSAITAASNMKQASVRSEIAFAIAAKQLKAQKQMGQAAVELLQAAAQLSKSLNTGKQIDLQG